MIDDLVELAASLRPGCLIHPSKPPDPLPEACLDEVHHVLDLLTMACGEPLLHEQGANLFADGLVNGLDCFIFQRLALRDTSDLA